MRVRCGRETSAGTRKNSSDPRRYIFIFVGFMTLIFRQISSELGSRNLPRNNLNDPIPPVGLCAFRGCCRDGGLGGQRTLAWMANQEADRLLCTHPRAGNCHAQEWHGIQICCLLFSAYVGFCCFMCKQECNGISLLPSGERCGVWGICFVWCWVNAGHPGMQGEGTVYAK